MENEGWVTSSVSNVHFSRLRLPNISHTCHQAERREGGKGWGSAERIRTTRIHNRFQQAVSSERECGWCHHTEGRNSTVALQMQHQGKTKVVERAERRKTTVTLRAHFSHRGNYFRGSNINHCSAYKQQDCTGLFFFLKHKSLNKGHLKFTVRSRNEPDTAS